MKIRISDIIVDKDRYRRTFNEVEALATSIEKRGLLHPIVITEDRRLVAGERRLRAHILLKRDEIECTLFADLSSLDRRLIELEENILREDLTWQERVIAIATIHSIHQEIEGVSKRHVGGGWSIQDMCDLLGGAGYGNVVEDIKLGNALIKKGEEEKNGSTQPKSLLEKEVKRLESVGTHFSEAKTKSSAFKLLQSNEDAALRTILAAIETVDQSSDTCMLYHSDCLEGLRKLESGGIDLVLTDPPWGINLDNTNYKDFRSTGELVRADSHDDIEFLRPIIKELFRVMKDDSHMYMFFAYKHYQTLYDILIENGFLVQRVPLHWWKHNAFNANAYQVFDSDYESFLFARKGSRRLMKTHGSIFDHPPVAAALKRHQAEKPLSLLQELIELSTVPNELVLDPFAGSASTLMAALKSNRRSIGYEMDEKHYLMAMERIQV